MNKTVQPKKPMIGSMSSKLITIDHRGCVVNPSLSFEEYQRVLNTWETVDRVSPIVIGDLLCEGQRIYGDDRVLQALITEGHRLETLKKRWWVCNKVPRHIRPQVELSLTHYEKVAALDLAQQERYLKQAVEYQLSSRDLGKLVNGTLTIFEGKLIERQDVEHPTPQPTANEPPIHEQDFEPEPPPVYSDDTVAAQSQAKKEIPVLCDRLERALQVVGCDMFNMTLQAIRQQADESD